MQVGMIGLGKMGANMSMRLKEHGHEVIGFDLGGPARTALEKEGISTVATLQDLVAKLESPRVCWVMVPAGKPTDDTVSSLGELLSEGDLVIDGGNSNYKTAVPYAELLAKKKILFADAGTSGGVWGLENGYCLMVGGQPEAIAIAEPIFLALAPKDGYAHVGGIGAGHFVKMVHNGIEYGLMQAYAEGFELMASATEFGLDMHEIASIWRYGSVVRSWLLELVELALRPEAHFEEIEGIVVDSGEGRWTIEEGLARSIPLPVITESLYRRYASRNNDADRTALLPRLRNQFGGHAVERQSTSDK